MSLHIAVKRLVGNQQRCLSAFASWVVYQSSDLLICNKPGGISVQGGPGVNSCLNEMAIKYLTESKQNENCKPYLLHRLDRDTSGLVMFAINAKAAAFYSKMFQQRKISKEYVAVVHGLIPESLKSSTWSSSTISLPLLTEKIGFMDRTFVDLQRGKESTTILKLIKEHPSKKFSLVQLQPQTGRKHQLRAHCSYLNIPIVGDNKYGVYRPKDGNLERKPPLLCLHAYSMKVPSRHDVKAGEFLHFKAPLPLHFLSFFPGFVDK
jgi:RluA family pseudouridine synthase